MVNEWKAQYSLNSLIKFALNNINNDLKNNNNTKKKVHQIVSKLVK